MADTIERTTSATTVHRTPVFMGMRKHTLDGSSRFVLPTLFVDWFKSSFVMTIDENRQLVLYPEDRFYELARVLKERRATQATDPQMARAVERIFALAEFVKADSNNRIQIPDMFRGKVGADPHNVRVDLPEKDLYLVGMLDRLAIMTEAGYQRYLRETVDDATLAESCAWLMRLTETSNDGGNESADGAGS